MKPTTPKTGLSPSTTLLLFSIAWLLINGATAVRGQSPLDGFDPNANGIVRVVVAQPDGKILLGGEFTALSPNGGAAVTRHRIARLNADGTLDPDFKPNANGAVDAIVVQPDGKILVGGQFSGTNSIGGQTRNYIARLDPTTGDADSFDPDANGIVRTIALQTDGKVLAGGVFTTIGGQTRNHIARLNAVFGAADVSFDPDANDVVRVITLQPDGKSLVGGQFTGANSIGGKTRNYIARLDTNGVADSFNPNANDVVRAIAVQADGKILAGGVFTGANSIGSQTRNHIARLDPTTGTADSFNPNANGDVLVITLQTDGKILAGGDFTGANSIGGQTRNRIARLNPATGLADSFDPKADDTVRTIAQQPDGKILAGGVFTTNAPSGGASVARNRIARLETDGRLDRTFIDLGIGGVAVYATAVQPDGKILIGGDFTSFTIGGVVMARHFIARLNSDGTLDTAFNPDPNSPVYSLAVQPDGKVLMGGPFTVVNFQTRNHLARVDAVTGDLDLTFDPNVTGSFVYSIAVQGDGKILAGGFFTSIGGQPRTNIARLDAVTGAADLTFAPNANFLVTSIAVQPDGRILAGGGFTSIGGQSRAAIARLDATTGAAEVSFDPKASAPVYAIAVQPDGKILIGGDFTTLSPNGGAAVTRNRIARLNAVFGAVDASFDPNANGTIVSIGVQADGKILAGGYFNSGPGTPTIGGQTRDFIARLDATTGAADSFNPTVQNLVHAIALQADGKILVGGTFANISGQPHTKFARLNNDTAALQNLAVTQTNVIWTLDGSSPQFARVTFESSTDNTNYTALGKGVVAGGNWTRTGFSLPGGVNLYIRARGYYHGGLQNGSESIIESVRNVVLPPTPLLNIQLSASTNIVLSWPTNFTGYTLEANTNLNTNVWSGVSPAPAVSGTNNAVTNATSGSKRFYRLHK